MYSELLGRSLARSLALSIFFSCFLITCRRQQNSIFCIVIFGHQQNLFRFTKMWSTTFLRFALNLDADLFMKLVFDIQMNKNINSFSFQCISFYQIFFKISKIWHNISPFTYRKLPHFHNNAHTEFYQTTGLSIYKQMFYHSTLSLDRWKIEIHGEWQNHRFCDAAKTD